MEMDYEKERQEAIAAGQKALSSLRQARDYLDKARCWGIVDILGGGLFSTLIKHNRMDQAHQYIADAKASLSAFERELADLNEFENIDLDTQDFWGFADLLFDGLITDVAMQNRIKDAGDAVERAIRKVQDILEKLLNDETLQTSSDK